MCSDIVKHILKLYDWHIKQIFKSEIQQKINLMMFYGLSSNQMEITYLQIRSCS